MYELVCGLYFTRVEVFEGYLFIKVLHITEFNIPRGGGNQSFGRAFAFYFFIFLNNVVHKK